MKKTEILAKAVLFRKDGKILAVRRSKTDVRRPLQWDFPGGRMDPGETYDETVVREVKEETGLDIKPESLQLVHAEADYLDDHNIVWLIYVGEPVGTDITLSYEHDKAEWMDIEDAIEDYDYARQKRALKYIFENDLMLYP